MTLVEHIYELRNRLFKAALAVLIAGIVAFIYFKPIFGFVLHPYCRLPHDKVALSGHGCTVYAFSVLDQFNARLKVSMFVGVIFAAPVWLYQMWRFITPGLHRNERKWASVFVALSSLLFGIGTVLAYFAMYSGLQFLLSVGGQSVTTLLDINGYLRYVTAMVLVFGLAFEFPLVLGMLNAVGVLPHKRLAGWRRQAIFLLFLFAAFATPGQDPFGMTALGAALWLLYEVTLVITRIHDRRQARREARARAAEGLENLSDDEISPLPPQSADFSDIS
ncbi:MAG: twin-arginine translocase subunit TatC [Actinomycetota bacterium]|nr:twin-arginine translocase subunit TatC [Actinomycetota bacterium]